MTRERFHAVFLAAIMALSVVAIGAGFAGSAAADGHVVTVGSSSGDDYESIQNAIDMEGADSVIELNDTEYATDVSINSPNITLRGGDSTPVVDGEITVTADQVTISGVTVTNSETGYGIVATDVSGLTIENSTLRNIGTATDGSAQAIYFDNSSGTIHNNTISNVADSNPESSKGVFIGDSDEAIRGEIEITDNDISGVSVNQSDFDSGGAGAYGILVNANLSDKLTVTGNDINDLSGLWAHGVGLEADTPNAEVSSNNIKNLNATKGDTSDTDAFRDEAAIFFGFNGDADTVSISENTFTDLAYGILPNPDTQQTSIGRIVVVDGPLQTAVDHAAKGDTIEVHSGTYEEIVVATDNITIRGPNADTPGHGRDATDLSSEAVIESADETGVTVKNDINVSIDGMAFDGQNNYNKFVYSGTDNWNQVSIKNSILTNGSGIVDLNGAGKFYFEGNYVVGNMPSNGITLWNAGSDQVHIKIENNSWQNNHAWAMNLNHANGTIGNNTFHETDDFNAYSSEATYKQWGVLLAASENDVNIKNNTFDSLTGSGVDLYGNFDGEVDITENTFRNSSDTALEISNNQIDDVGGTFQPEDDDITISQNEFANNDVDVNSEVASNLSARYNYFIDTSPTVVGNITYDPFLTVKPDQVDADPVSETTDFGHDLIIPANGKPHSVAFPAPVEGNVSEVFGDFNGTVYAYDGDEWKSGEEVRDEDIDALDAFVVTVDEDKTDLRIEFEYAENEDPVPSMTTTNLEAGWNFVGAPYGSMASNEAFAGSTAEITTVIDVFAGQNTVSTPYGLDASGEVSNPSRVSPFKGYWVFVTDDGELGATVPVEPAQETEEGALTGN